MFITLNLNAPQCTFFNDDSFKHHPKNLIALHPDDHLSIHKCRGDVLACNFLYIKGLAQKSANIRTSTYVGNTGLTIAQLAGKKGAKTRATRIDSKTGLTMAQMMRQKISLYQDEHYRRRDWVINVYTWSF